MPGDQHNITPNPLTTAKYFVILAAMRTGSNLLQSNLNQFKDILCLGELFNRSFVGVNIPGKSNKAFAGYARADVESRDRDEMLFFDRVYAEAKGKVFGFRMFSGQNDRLLDIILKNDNCRKAILKRNALDSFISLQIANKSSRWLSRKSERVQDDTVSFSMKKFLQYVDGNEKFYRYCESVIRETGQEYYEIRYEQLKDLDELNRLAQFIGSQRRKSQIKEKIYKQTLPGLAHKVVNYDAMIQALKDEGLYNKYMAS